MKFTCDGSLNRAVMVPVFISPVPVNDCDSMRNFPDQAFMTIEFTPYDLLIGTVMVFHFFTAHWTSNPTLRSSSFRRVIFSSGRVTT